MKPTPQQHQQSVDLVNKIHPALQQVDVNVAGVALVGILGLFLNRLPREERQEAATRIVGLANLIVEHPGMAWPPTQGTA